VQEKNTCNVCTNTLSHVVQEKSAHVGLNKMCMCTSFPCGGSKRNSDLVEDLNRIQLSGLN